MTDRYSAYIITMEDDMRDDDAEFTINALKMIKGVANVKPLISNPQEHVGREREKRRAMSILNDAWDKMVEDK